MKSAPAHVTYRLFVSSLAKAPVNLSICCKHALGNALPNGNHLRYGKIILHDLGGLHLLAGGGNAGMKSEEQKKFFDCATLGGLDAVRRIL